MLYKNTTKNDLYVPAPGKTLFVKAGQTVRIEGTINFPGLLIVETPKKDKKITVNVGIMDVEIDPGEDGVFGTKDDVTEIKKAKPRKKKKAPKKDTE